MNLESKAKFSQPFVIKPEQADLKHDLFPNHLMWILQECSVNQVEELGVGYYYLIQNHLAWALAGFEFDVKMLPKWRETVQVSTWHKKEQGLFSYRDFQMRDLADNVLVNATSTWFVMDLDKRKPVPISKVFPELLACEEDALDSKLRRATMGQPPEREADYTSNHTVLFTDLDHNGHCNNVHYIRWMFYDLPTSFLMENLIKHFEIYFVKELNVGEKITEKTWKLENEKCFMHCIYHESGELAAISKSQWGDRSTLSRCEDHT